MIKSALITTSSIILLSTAAYAAGSVAEKKAKDTANESINDGIERVTSGCGITPTVDVNWSAIDGYDFASLGRDKNNVIKTIGSNANGILLSLKHICSDADYKAAIAGISSISITPTSDPKANGNKANKYVVEGSTLSVTMAPITTDSDASHHLRSAF